MIPEILLVGEIDKKFRESFSEEDITLFHSRLTQKERFLAVEKIKTNDTSIILATRSVLFLPLDHLGMIIVDEEHDQSFKQNESPFFHARDCAVYLANLLSCSVLLGSATPSLESYYNAKKQKYHLLELNKRVLQRPLPQVHYVDLKSEKKTNGIFYLSESLKTKLEVNFFHKKQAVLFLNRRGFATLLKCKNCQECYYCPNCSIPMKLHKKKNASCNVIFAIEQSH